MRGAPWNPPRGWDLADVPPVPGPIARELAALDAQLNLELPGKKLDRNLLVATWNIRGFGGVTEAWEAGPGVSPVRDLHAVACIAAILRRFDVIALQEVKGNHLALKHAMRMLGPYWSVILTDVSGGDEGNDERMAFLFDTRKVTLSGLACELVLAGRELTALGRQFDRTPYAVGFRCLEESFTLVSLHVRWGKGTEEKKREERRRELFGIAEWLLVWARDPDAWDRNLIAMGDFNIDRSEGELYEAFTSSGLTVPEDLIGVPRTLSDRGTGGRQYDQIAWFTGCSAAPPLELAYIRGGHFDFTRVAMRTRKLSRKKLSYRISDHFPLWAEFEVRRR